MQGILAGFSSVKSRPTGTRSLADQIYFRCLAGLKLASAVELSPELVSCIRGEICHKWTSTRLVICEPDGIIHLVEDNYCGF